MSLMAQDLWRDKLYTGGGWVAGAGPNREVVEPATGRTLGRAGTADADQVRRAATTAAAEQREWARQPPAERARVLRRAGDLWQEYAAQVQDWLVREAGSISAKAALEVQGASAICWEAASLPSHPAGEVLTSNERRWSIARRRPAGVVSVIAPFNFPLILAIRSVAPALALGNAVLLKPDPRTAVCGGVSLARVFAEAGLPEGLLHVLPGGAEVGAAVVEAPEVAVVSFTGSTAAGRKVGEAAARGLKKVHLELGGNNALVVLPGADVGEAAAAGAFGSWLHQGQICMTTGRHLVHESLVEDYLTTLAAKADRLSVGDPASAEVALGPIIDRGQLDHIESLVRAAVDRGAEVRAGGVAEGPCYRPTVLRCDTASAVWRTEIFGPVAPVTSFATVAEAAAIVNDSEYGLSVGIIGEVGAAMELADLVHAGKVHINEQTVSDEANVPFGGVKDSGNGSRFGGAAANIDAFTEVQWVTLRPEVPSYPF